METIDLPEPGPDEALVRISHAGVNFPDKLVVEGKYQHKPALPFVPGREIAGEVIGTGQAVMASVNFGGFAEAAVVPRHALRPIPEGLSMAQAAAFSVATHTAYVALLERGQMTAGEVVLVLGAAGGVGLATVQLAAALGATVVAVASTEEKRQAALVAGADHAIAPGEDLKERVQALTDGHGADIVFDPVGGDAFDAAIRTLAWDGRYLVIGFAAGRIPILRVNRALIKGISVIGVRAGEHVRQNPERGPVIREAIDALAA
ncbi:MAG: NADPH:quinone oxidoreductase family protein, partial [Alphaproteobacteria bacterium]|nr:NADPH:quinone oxidoreductase family protein [Alphaproteobacteria bacterium]